MGSCCYNPRRETKPLLSETSKQKLAMKRAILLDHPQRTLEINIDDIHSHNSLPLSMTNYKHNHSLQNQNHSLQNQSLNQKQIEIEKLFERAKDGSITFYPLPVQVSDRLLPTESIIHSNQLKCFCKEFYGTDGAINNIETISGGDNFTILQYNNYNNKYIHPFINCLKIGYFNHYPLTLSPSHIWLLILQSVSIRIHLNKHQSKTIILPQNTENMLTQTDIETEIDKNIMNTAQLLLQNDYTTSTQEQNIASKICLMNIYQQKSSQNISSLNVNHNKLYDNKCTKHKHNTRGFASIHLIGTKQDWIKLKTKTVNLLESDKIETEFYKKWSVLLIPILDKFIHTYDGIIDKIFWNNMIVPTDNYDGTIDKKYSWINVLFPHGSFGFGVSSTTINVNDKLKDFLSGFIGVSQHNKTLAIEPYIGWFVVNRTNDTQ